MSKYRNRRPIKLGKRKVYGLDVNNSNSPRFYVVSQTGRDYYIRNPFGSNPEILYVEKRGGGTFKLRHDPRNHMP